MDKQTSSGVIGASTSALLVVSVIIFAGVLMFFTIPDVTYDMLNVKTKKVFIFAKKKISI